jgi:hypothetical protein
LQLTDDKKVLTAMKKNSIAKSMCAFRFDTPASAGHLLVTPSDAALGLVGSVRRLARAHAP